MINFLKKKNPRLLIFIKDSLSQYSSASPHHSPPTDPHFLFFQAKKSLYKSLSSSSSSFDKATIVLLFSHFSEINRSRLAAAMSTDIERGGATAGGKGRGATGYYGARNGAAAPSPFFYDAGSSAEREWTSWIVPLIVVANVAMFIVTMYVNNCPHHTSSYGSCVARFLHRFSFQPLRQNPLFGPSSST